MPGCLICKELFSDFRELSVHIRNNHYLTSREYIDSHLGKGKCLLCSGYTAFKNLNIGYRKFCSVKCLNIHKSKRPEHIKLMSLTQKGKPRRKHNPKTKEKCRQIMLNEWLFNREKRLAILKSKAVREKISKSVSQVYKVKHITEVNGRSNFGLKMKDF